MFVDLLVLREKTCIIFSELEELTFCYHNSTDNSQINNLIFCEI